ncbi:MAG: DUF4037 domain-containing protein [Armatimonadota bacterium]|nr:DUF4037 domain-containing protein [Armatimonadota bacterium]
MPTFIPGLKLSELFYQEAVEPILAAHFPELQYSAALLGVGSDVLEFDDEMSTDHDWGPRLVLVLREREHEALHAPIWEALSRNLPRIFRGCRTNFSRHDPFAAGSINHHVEIRTLASLLPGDVDPDNNGEIAPVEWLSFSQQSLCELTSGVVYRDDVGLQALRDQFRFYPHDVWLYLLVASWKRIGQEQHLMGRAGFAGDELGSAIIGSRLVREIMRLGFWMEKQYAPYPKWFGTAFRRLACGPALLPLLEGAQMAATWHEREQHLCAAYERLVAMHDALGITEPLSFPCIPFHVRPFRIIDTEVIINALRRSITDKEVQRIADLWARLGNIDQMSDSPDLLMGYNGSSKLHRLWE